MAVDNWWQRRERDGSHYPASMGHLGDAIDYASHFGLESSRRESAQAAGAEAGWRDDGVVILHAAVSSKVSPHGLTPFTLSATGCNGPRGRQPAHLPARR